MGRAKPTKRRSLGPLVFTALLLISSAFVRVSDHAGQALAKKPEQVDISEASNAEPSSPNISAVLAALAEREARVEKSETQLALRFAALEEAEIEISTKIGELRQAEDALRDTLALADNASENDLARLTAVYENMKPKEAAELFEQMDPQFAAGFLGRMKPAAAAGVMAGLTPEVAYAISAVLAGRNSEVPKE